MNRFFFRRRWSSLVLFVLIPLGILNLIAFQQCTPANFGQQDDTAAFSSISGPEKNPPAPTNPGAASPQSCGGLPYLETTAVLNDATTACSESKAAPFRNVMMTKMSEQGLALRNGGRFLGCNARNMKAGQETDIWPADLRAYDGIVFFHVSGMNLTLTLNTNQLTGDFLVMSNMESAGGSGITLNVTGAAASKVGYVHRLLNSGGSNLAVNLPHQSKVNVIGCASGGSTLRLGSQQTVRNVMNEDLRLSICNGQFVTGYQCL